MVKKKTRLIKIGIVFFAIYLFSLMILLFLDSSATMFDAIKNPIDLSKNVMKQLYQDTDLDLPYDNDGKLPNGRDIPHQWKGRLGRYVLVGQSNVTTFTRPSRSATSYMTLAGSQRVRVVYKSTFSTTVDDRVTNWVFITDEAGKAPLGWVPNTFLGYSNSFVKIDIWDKDDFGFCKGEYCAEYKVNLNGRYMSKWGSQGSDIFLNGASKGQLFQFQNVIVALQDEREFFHDIFFINSDEELVLEHKFQELSIRKL